MSSTKKRLVTIAAVLLLTVLIGCNGNKTDTVFREQETARSGSAISSVLPDEGQPTLHRAIFELSIEDAVQSDMINLCFDDFFSTAYNSGMGLRLFISDESLETVDFNIETSAGSTTTKIHLEYRIYDETGNLVLSDKTWHSLNYFGELDYKWESFLWYIRDINKSGMYAMTVYAQYYDSEKQQTLGLYSTPLYFDITIEDNNAVFEVIEEDLPVGGAGYYLSGDIFMDSLYGYTLYYNDASREPIIRFTYLNEDGGFVQGGSRMAEHFDIQRFYNIETGENIARFSMTSSESYTIRRSEYKENFVDKYLTKKQPPEYAYLEVFKQYYAKDIFPLKNTTESYKISVDLSRVLYEKPELIKKEIEEYLNDMDVELLWDDMENLIENGYVIADKNNGFPLYFDNGSLFIFNDKTLTDVLFETDATMWYGNTGATGAFFELRHKAGKWTITYRTMGWIS